MEVCTMSFLDLVKEGIEISVMPGRFQGYLLVRFQRKDQVRVYCFERTITYTEMISFKGSSADLESIICEEALKALAPEKENKNGL